MGDRLACCSSMSEWWYEPSWGVNCGPKPDRVNSQRVAQIVSDVSVDVSDVSEVSAHKVFPIRRNNEIEKVILFERPCRYDLQELSQTVTSKNVVF